MSTIKNYDVMIVGAGAAGTLCALTMAGKGLQVALMDRADLCNMAEPEIDGRTVALMSGSCEALADVGVLDELMPVSCALESLRIVDDSYWPQENTSQEVLFRAQELDQDVFGYNIPLGRLHYALVNKTLGHERIAVYDNASIDQISQGGRRISMTLENGDSLNAPLLVGADGRRSIVRDYAGIDVSERDYNTSAMTFLIEHEKHHDNISTEFHRPSGPFTYVPMPGGHSASIVWADKTENVEQFLSLPKQAMEQEIQSRTRDYLGDIKLASGVKSWPLISMHAEAMYGERIALVAEAAHVMSPIGAQGLNLSIRDVMDLTQIIGEAAMNGQDFGSFTHLDRYAKTRKVDLALRNKGIDAFHRGVSTDNPALHKLRRTGLHAISVLEPLRHALMQEGLNPRRNKRAS